MDILIQCDYLSATPLFYVMHSVSNTGCNAIAMSGTFEQLKDQFKEVANLAMGFYPPDTPTKSVTNETEPANAEDSNVGKLPGIKTPVLPPYGGPELAVLLNTPLLHGGIEDCVHVIDIYRNNPYVKGWFIMNEPRHWDWGNVVLADPLHPPPKARPVNI